MTNQRMTSSERRMPPGSSGGDRRIHGQESIDRQKTMKAVDRIDFEPYREIRCVLVVM